jgi:hypothetical protein
MLLCCLSSAASYEPLDNRTWEHVVAHLTDISPNNTSDRGERDAKRLKELDYHKALETLLPLLSCGNPEILRLRVIDGIGRCGFREAIPAIEKIVSAPTETLGLRRLALNIGLRYMESDKAVDIAERYVDDKDEGMRRSAHWVLSDHGGNREIMILEKCLKTDRELRANILFALYGTGNEKVGHLVFKILDVQEVHTNTYIAWIYSEIMAQYRIPEASEVMFSLFSHESSRVKRNALVYFIRLPHVTAIPVMIKYLEDCNEPIYYDGTKGREDLYKILDLKGITDVQRSRLRDLLDKNSREYRRDRICR